MKLAEIEKEFRNQCELVLPVCLMVDGVNYKLTAGCLLTGGFRISYGEFDGNYFNWKNKPIDLFYNIIEKDGEIDLTFNDIFDDCFVKLNNWHKGQYTKLDEIITKDEMFLRELTVLLNKYSKENESNSPDFILAAYLVRCLDNFNMSINIREKWYNRK